MSILVYVVGPFSAPTRAGVEANIDRAERVGLELARLGYFPIIPHTNTRHPEFSKAQEYGFWVAGYLKVLAACRAVVMVPGWQVSEGASKEYAEAARIGIRVFETVSELEAWARGYAIIDGGFRREMEP